MADGPAADIDVPRGATVVNVAGQVVMPGSGHLMSGQTTTLKLRDAATTEAMRVCDDPQTEICGGMRTRPKRPDPIPVDCFTDAPERAGCGAWVSPEPPALDRPTNDATRPPSSR